MVRDLRALKDYEQYPVDKYFIIGEFDQLAKNDEDKEVPCQGFIGSSKSILNNLTKLTQAQPDGLVLYLDGTYKLLINGWVLILLGGVTIKLTSAGAYSHSFVPILECITRSECEPAFSALFRALCLVADKYATMTLKISVLVQDHCQASANAVRNTLQRLLPQVKRKYFIMIIIYLLTLALEKENEVLLGGCETHVLRKIDEQKRLLQNNDYYEATVQPFFRDLVNSANESIFFLLIGYAIKDWQSKIAFRPFVAWLQKVYINVTWYRFANYVTPPGCDTKNQILEACNKGMLNFLAKKVNTTRSYITC